MTTSRRDFLGIAAVGSAVAASGVFSGGTSAAAADMSQAGGRSGSLWKGWTWSSP